jgi:hypothetical protein
LWIFRDDQTVKTTGRVKSLITSTALFLAIDVIFPVWKIAREKSIEDIRGTGQELVMMIRGMTIHSNYNTGIFSFLNVDCSVEFDPASSPVLPEV